MSFLADVKAAEVRVREAIDRAAAPSSSFAEDRAHGLLDAALAAALVRALHYRQRYYMMRSIRQEHLQGLFEAHWQDEQSRLQRIAERIEQLGSVPKLDPQRGDTRDCSPLVTGYTVVLLLREVLSAQRIMIAMYRTIVEFFAETDPVSQRMFEAFLEAEERHANEVERMLSPVAAVDYEVAGRPR
jgi:bacterioferritin